MTDFHIAPFGAGTGFFSRPISEGMPAPDDPHQRAFFISILMLNIDDRILDTLNEAETFLLLQIAKRMKPHDMRSWPSIPTLAKDCRWSENTVRRWRDSLIEKGWFSMEVEHGKPPVYRVLRDGIGVFFSMRSDVPYIEDTPSKFEAPAKIDPLQNLKPPPSKFEAPPLQNLNPNIISNKNIIRKEQIRKGETPKSESIFTSEPKPYAKQNTPPAPPPPVAVTIHDEIETPGGPVTVEISERVKIAADAVNSTPNERSPQSAKTSKVEREDAIVSEIIGYLNEKAKKGYRTTTKENRSGILARYREGATVEEMKAVIDDRVKEWGRELKSREWLNPVCLFRPGNFERYKETVADKNRLEAEKAKQQQPTVSPQPSAQPAYRDPAQGMRRF